MKELLLAIQAQLRTDLTYVRSGDIYITPHLNYIPSHVRAPCIGIKDGGITRREELFGMWELTMAISIVVYVQLLKDEASIIGDAAADQKGVLDIIDDINASLDENLLDIDGMQAAYSPSEGASEMFGNEEAGLQSKVINFEYIKEEERP